MKCQIMQQKDVDGKRLTRAAEDGDIETMRTILDTHQIDVNEYKNEVNLFDILVDGNCIKVNLVWRVTTSPFRFSDGSNDILILF